MPTFVLYPRQGTTGHTTKTSYLVVVASPLNQKPSTTYFQHSFLFLIQQFLQYFTKPPKSPNSDSSLMGCQFFNLRLYVPKPRCTLGQFQPSSLPCCTAYRLGNFFHPNSGLCLFLLHILNLSKLYYPDYGPLDDPKSLKRNL